MRMLNFTEGWADWSLNITLPPYKVGTIMGLATSLPLKIKQAKECTGHELDYQLYGNGYRRYRRGKNRCPRCGVRL